MMKIAVFASGTGTNFVKLIEAIENKQVDANPVLLICDQPNAKVIEKAEKLGVKTLVYRPKDFADKATYETEVLSELRAHKVDGIVLAGYMRLIGDVLLNAYGGKIINLHPSLLPSFAGKDAIGQAWEKGVKVTGITIHFVDEGMDTGPIIAQKPYEIKETDTLESLTEEIHKIEHEWYPKIVQYVIKNYWKEA